MLRLFPKLAYGLKLINKKRKKPLHNTTAVLFAMLVPD